MHFDSTLRRPGSSTLLVLLLASYLAAAFSQALLIPPQQESESDAIEQFSKLIEALHEQSGGYHQRFKSLMFQSSQDDQALNAVDDDNLPEDDFKSDKKHSPKDGDGKDKIKLVPVVLGVMSKCPDAEVSLHAPIFWVCVCLRTHSRSASQFLTRHWVRSVTSSTSRLFTLAI